MKLKTALGIGALTLLSFLAPALAKAEAKIDTAFSFVDRPAQEYRMTGQRIGFYDENIFFGAETREEKIKGETQTRNLAGAMVPISLDDRLLTAEIMGSQEPEQSSMGIRLIYFFDDRHSLGPIVESLTAKTGNKTLYGLQGHMEWNGVRTEGGIYQITTPTNQTILVNGLTNFTALDHKFGIGWKLSPEQQWYGFAVINLEGNIGYRLKLNWEPTVYSKTSI